ncbi:MAG: CocE/NonD family hydrolase [Pseudomonadota bacterium]
MKWLKRGLYVVAGIIALGLFAFLWRHELLRMRSDMPSFTHSAGDDFDAMVPMLDGVELYTTVQMPGGEGPFPAVLIRNPYAQARWVMQDLVCGLFVRYGYACVFQDTRGRGRSQGEWDPATSEISDGADTLKWLARQDFQDGNLAMVGSSYLASVQYAALAGDAPPELKTIVPAMYATDNRTVMYQDGLFRHETFTAWTSMMRGPGSDTDNAAEEYRQAARYRPHSQVDTDVFGLSMPWYTDMLNAAAPADPFWQAEDRVKMRQVPQNTDIPVLMVGGWYDVFFGPQFEDWQRLATQSSSRYVIGPWVHNGEISELVSEDVGDGRFYWREMLPWLDYHLKGIGPKPETGISIYVIGKDAGWQDHTVWPSKTTYKSFFLSNLAAANSCEEGRLSATPGNGEAEFIYNPDDPVPTRGGAGMLAFTFPGFEGAKPANVDQAGLCERDDVLTFQTAQLEAPMLISGNIELTLDIASTAPDTAFTAKLVEVFPDGRAFNIRDSITSLAYRNGAQAPLSYQPGDRVSLRFDFWPIAWRMQAGSRLRLDVSSSDFPKFHAHTNRAGPWAEQSGADLATQTLYGGEVKLPVE